MEGQLLRFPSNAHTLARHRQEIVTTLAQSAFADIRRHRGAYRSSNVPKQGRKFAHRNLLQLPRLDVYLFAHEPFEDVLVWNDAGVTPLRRAILTGRLPLHLLLNFLGTNHSQLICSLGDLLWSPIDIRSFGDVAGGLLEGRTGIGELLVRLLELDLQLVDHANQGILIELLQFSAFKSALSPIPGPVCNLFFTKPSRSPSDLPICVF